MTFAVSQTLVDSATQPPPILVVDDSRAQRRLLARTLARWGYHTIEAESGEAALELCQRMAIDIVVSDWMMPGMSGVEFCKAFRILASERPAYFILLTAQTEREVLAEGLESGADDFLSKPFNTVELKARLQAGERVLKAQRDLSDKNLALSGALKELRDAYAAIDRDLRGARKFQEALVPDRNLSLGSFELSLLFQSSGHVGGDLVGYFRVNETQIGVYSVDVSGHGVASALMTARIAGYLSDDAPDRNIALVRGEDGYSTVPLSEACTRLNELLQADTDSDQYLTLTLAVIDLTSGAVDICQAGHPSPAVQRADGTVEFMELWSTPIGLIEDGDFSSATLQLDRGERLILYSDGITECPDQDDVQLDEDGLAGILMAHVGKTGLDLVDAIVNDLVDFRGQDDFPDDLSAVVVERV